MDKSRIYIFYNYSIKWNRKIQEIDDITKNTLLDVINGRYIINICDLDQYLIKNRKNKINKQISKIKILGKFIDLPSDEEIGEYNNKKIIYEI
jgi:hypothetical protein